MYAVAGAVPRLGLCVYMFLSELLLEAQGLCVYMCLSGLAGTGCGETNTSKNYRQQEFRHC